MDTRPTYQCTDLTDKTWKEPLEYMHHQNVPVKRAAKTATWVLGE